MLRIRTTLFIKILIIIGLMQFTALTGGLSVLPVGFGLQVDGLRNILLLMCISFVVFDYLTSLDRKLVGITDIWPLLLFVSWASLSVLWSLNKGYAVRDLLKLFYPILLFLVARSTLRRSQNPRKFFEEILAILAIFCIISFVSSIWGVVTGARTVVWGEDRLNTALIAVHPVVAGLYIFCELSGRIFLPKWRGNLVALYCAFAYILLTITRVYILGVFIGIAAIFWIKLRNPVLRVFLVAVSTVFFLAVIFVDGPIKRRMFFNPDRITLSVVIQEPSILLSPQEVRMSGRDVFWRFVINELHGASDPLIGGGIGSSRFLLADSRAFRNVAVPHGIYAKYLGELGWIGFSIFILGVLFSAWYVYRKASITKDPLQKWGYTILLSGIVYMIFVDIAYEVFDNAFDYMAILIVLYATLRAARFLNYTPKTDMLNNLVQQT